MEATKILYRTISLIIILSIETYSYAATENKIIANVQDQIISTYELKNKIKTILFLTNRNMNQENINLTKKRALQELIEFKLKDNEIKKFDVQSSNNSLVNNNLKSLSFRLKTDVNGVKKIFENNGLDYEIYFNELNIQSNWQNIILQRFANKISLDEKEVNNELSDLIKSKMSLNEYKLGEIEILLKNNLEDKNIILEINYQIKEIGFEKTAMKYSLSTSSAEGGNIGWISSKSLSKEILNILNELKIGEVSRPILQTDTITLLKLLDTRITESKDIDLDKLRKRIIDKKKNELLNLYSNNYLSKLKNNAFIEFK